MGILLLNLLNSKTYSNTNTRKDIGQKSALLTVS
jgi:hypothetical protein